VGAARFVTHWPATVAAFLTPIAMGVIFLRTPVLPQVALEVDDGPRILRGQLVDVDDHMTSLLDNKATVRFVRNDLVRDIVLCAGSEQIPYSVVEVRGWPVETSAIEWLLPRREPLPDDPRCSGRLPG
jgi:small nuclear ribonucleoprotein (snRNP)-like protein